MHNKWKIAENIIFESDKLNKNLRVSPWAGHRYFAYDLISFLKPDIIVELGTHYGCSFFSFLQSIKDNNLSTQIFAIDSWEGEEHAGKYGSDVYDLVNKTTNKFFSKQNVTLLKMYFDKAVNEFEDNSIDILHIDGLHTYEATKEDFFNYLPKLKENGIVLFHDIADYTGYGSHEFWIELKSKYQFHFEFNHDWGLGILFPKGNMVFDLLKKEKILDFLNYYQYRGKYDLLNIQNKDKEIMIDERDKTIKAQEIMIDERDKTIKAQEIMINERDIAIKSQDKLVEERDKYIKELEKRLNG